jgi:3-oxoacyl-[acyl-carrier protein] reductase
VDIAGARVLITGGARGLGRVFALDLAAAGARVGACDLDGAGLAELVSEASSRGATVWTREADVSAEASVEALLAAFTAQMGGIDAIVNNAGLNRDGLLIKKSGDDLVKLPLSSWQTVIDVDLTGVFLCAREAAFHMVKQGSGGVIVNISSLSWMGNAGQTNYSAAKAGVVALTRTWGMELPRYGIRTVAIAPGITATEMAEAMPEEARERLTSAVPLRRMAQPAEVSLAVRFALENDYLNGRVIPVDGGLRL